MQTHNDKTRVIYLVSSSTENLYLKRHDCFFANLLHLTQKCVPCTPERYSVVKTPSRQTTGTEEPEEDTLIAGSSERLVRRRCHGFSRLVVL